MVRAGGVWVSFAAPDSRDSIPRLAGPYAHAAIRGFSSLLALGAMKARTQKPACWAAPKRAGVSVLQHALPPPMANTVRADGALGCVANNNEDFTLHLAANELAAVRGSQSLLAHAMKPRALHA